MSAAVAAIRRHLGAMARELLLAVVSLLLQLLVAIEAVQSQWLDLDRAAVVIAMLGCGEGILLAAARVRRWVAFALGLPLGIAAVVPLTLASRPELTGAPAMQILQTYLGAFRDGIGASHWGYLVWISTVLWSGGAWLGWVALAERRGALAALPAMVWIAVSVLNAPHPQQLVVTTLGCLAAALLLLALVTLQAKGEVSWRMQLVPLSRLAPPYIGYSSAFVAIVILTGAVLPPLSNVDLSGHLFTQLHPPAGDGGGSGGGGGQTPTIGYQNSVVPGGPLRSDPQPVLTYASGDGRPTYLTVTYDTLLNEGNWYPANGGSPAHRTLIQSPGDFPYDRRSPESEAPVRRQVETVTVLTTDRGATGSSAEALFPGDPLYSNLSGTLAGVSSPLGNDVLVSPESEQLWIDGTKERLTTRGDVSDASVAQLRQAGTDYPVYISGGTVGDVNYPGYLSGVSGSNYQLSRIRELARQMVAGTTNNYDAAVAIENTLRSDYHYTLTPSAPPPGMWPVTYFLTQSKSGYCQYFASAMGMLLRSAGIPSRLVSGYGPGTQAGANTYAVSTSDAHTWVEAYFPHYGWVPFEPTPPSNQGDYGTFARGGASPAPSNPAASPSASAKPTPRPHPTARATGLAGAGTSAGPPPWLAVGICTVAALLLWLCWYYLWWIRPRDLGAAWRRARLLGRIRGLPQRPSETYLAYAARLQRDAPMVIPVAELARAISAITFSGRPAGPAETKRALRLGGRVAAATPRALWRRLHLRLKSVVP